jgi:hypothetical protein
VSELKIERLPKEFQLVAACCRWPRSELRDQAIRSAGAGDLDWQRLMKIAARHRVEGLVADGILGAGLAAPDQVKESLQKHLRTVAMDNLTMARESLRLQLLADEAGIRMLILKGVTINILGYGSLGLKKAWDIDLLVDPEELDTACSLLRSAGYSRRSPDASLPDEAARELMKLGKESLWMNASGDLAVELHTALTDNPAMIPTLGLNSPLQHVAVAPGNVLRTLGDTELVAYLCVHGAAHAWARLKWLADLAALLGARTPEQIEGLHRRAVELGAGRSSAQALLLCADLLAIPLTSGLRMELRKDPVNRWLQRIAMRTMAGPYLEKELSDSVFGTAPIQLSHFFLQHGLQYKAAELRQKLANPHGPTGLGLPSYLAFLNPLLSLPHWVWRRSRGKLFGPRAAQSKREAD